MTASRYSARHERLTAVGMVTLTSLAALWIDHSIGDLQHANDCRRAQLTLLQRAIERPCDLPVGPVAALDGLFGRRIARVDFAGGPALAFVDQGEGQRP